MTVPKTRRVGALAGLLLVTSAMTASAQSIPGETVSLQQLVTILGRGDQDALERYIASNYDPEVLRATSAKERADRLARLYVDSGGFVITKPVQGKAGAEAAFARAKYTDLPSCLTLKTKVLGTRTLITDFAAVDLPLPASKSLRTPGAQEVVSTMSRFIGRLARADTFSGVMLIAKDGRPLMRKAYGKASLAYNAPNHIATRFNIASIGKTMTAVAIGQLLDEGRLSLDDKIGKFLPDYPDKPVRDKVTVRHLLTHTSGLGPKSEFTNSPLWNARRSRIRTVAAHLPLIIGHPLESEPGSQYSYSNAGFVILGLIIEKVTGQSFYDVVARKVFAPAGMTGSLYHEADSQEPDVATPLTNFVPGIFPISSSGEPAVDDYGFRLGRKRAATLEGSAKGGAHGGAFATADDMFKFITAVRTAKLTSPDTARLLTTRQEDVRLPGAKTGLGFETWTQNGHNIIGHNGGDLGVSAITYHFNESGYTTIILSNYDPRAIRAIARKVRGLLTRSAIGELSPAPATDCTA